MAYDCDQIRVEFARQTPVYQDVFLDDYVSRQLTTEPFMGRHKTETWGGEKDTIVFDKLHVQQPDYTSPWERINGDDCGNACEPPRTTVGYGTTRDSAYMEQKDLQSPPFCLQQLRTVPNIKRQVSKIYEIISQLPATFVGDFLRTRFTSYHDTIQIAGSGLDTFAVTSANTSTNLTTIDLGNAANLPTSTLTLDYLSALAQELIMNGYDIDSGLPAGMVNLVTHSRQYQSLVGQNPALRAQVRFQDIKSLSPLYQVGKGINGEPFGFLAPTFDNKQVRFQHSGNGLLQRVFPYLNTAATTGGKPQTNPAWLNARYALSYYIHPKAATLFTPTPSKIHELVPSLNSAMFGKWKMVNPEGVIQLTNPDGSVCTKNNDNQFWFYWLTHLEAGFKYEQRELVMPILHLIDGRGADCLVDAPVCGDAPAYVEQDYSGSSTGFCET